MKSPRLRDYFMLAAAPAFAAFLVMLVVVGVGTALVLWPALLGGDVNAAFITQTIDWLLRAGMIAAIALAALVAVALAWRLVPRLGNEGARRPSGPQPADYAKLAALPVGVLLAAGLLFGLLSQFGIATKEISLTVLLAAGVVALVLGLAVVAVFMAWHKLADARAPLGLPEGSVRAVIALTLILIFAILSIFVFSQTNPSTSVSPGLTAAQVELLDPARITQITPRLAVQSVGNDGQPTLETVYDVQLSSAPSEASVDLANQLITTVGTLVAAIAAFYFGANSVASASQAIAATRPTKLRIVSVRPNRVERDADGKPLPVVVTTDTRTLGEYTAEILDDAGGGIEELDPGVFTYTPGSNLGPQVGLRFARADGSGIAKIVRLPVVPPAGAPPADGGGTGGSDTGGTDTGGAGTGGSDTGGTDTGGAGTGGSDAGGGGTGGSGTGGLGTGTGAVTGAVVSEIVREETETETDSDGIEETETVVVEDEAHVMTEVVDEGEATAEVEPEATAADAEPEPETTAAEGQPEPEPEPTEAAAEPQETAAAAEAEATVSEPSTTPTSDVQSQQTYSEEDEGDDDWEPQERGRPTPG